MACTYNVKTKYTIWQLFHLEVSQRGSKVGYKGSGHVCVPRYHLMCGECGLLNPSQLTRKRPTIGSLHSMIDAFLFSGGCNLPTQLFHCYQTNTGLDRGNNWSNTIKCQEWLIPSCLLPRSHHWLNINSLMMSVCPLQMSCDNRQHSNCINIR